MIRAVTEELETGGFIVTVDVSITVFVCSLDITCVDDVTSGLEKVVEVEFFTGLLTEDCLEEDIWVVVLEEMSVETSVLGVCSVVDIDDRVLVFLLDFDENSCETEFVLDTVEESVTSTIVEDSDRDGVSVEISGFKEVEGDVSKT